MVVFESNGGIFDSLAPFGCDLWRFEILKFVRNLEPTQKFLKNFYVLIGAKLQPYEIIRYEL